MSGTEIAYAHRCSTACSRSSLPSPSGTAVPLSSYAHIPIAKSTPPYHPMQTSLIPYAHLLFTLCTPTTTTLCTPPYHPMHTFFSS
eukprot:5457-Rhodomonas_salina.5